MVAPKLCLWPQLTFRWVGGRGGGWGVIGPFAFFLSFEAVPIFKNIQCRFSVVMLFVSCISVCCWHFLDTLYVLQSISTTLIQPVHFMTISVTTRQEKLVEIQNATGVSV